jgi:hypothetical protein
MRIVLLSLSLIFIAAAIAPAQDFEPFRGSIIERFIAAAEPDGADIIWKPKVTISGTFDGFVRVPLEGGGFVRVLKLRYDGGVTLVRISQLWRNWLLTVAAEHGDSTGWPLTMRGILKPIPARWKVKHRTHFLRPLAVVPES